MPGIRLLRVFAVLLLLCTVQPGVAVAAVSVDAPAAQAWALQEPEAVQLARSAGDLSDANQARLERQRDLQGVLLGILLMSALFHLLRSRHLHDLRHAWLALLSLGLLVALTAPFDTLGHWLPLSAPLQWLITQLGIAVALLASAGQALQDWQDSRRWRWPLLLAGLPLLLAASLDLGWLLTLLGSLAVALVLARGIRDLRQGHRSAWEQIGAGGLFAVTAGSVLPALIGLTPLSPTMGLLLLTLASLGTLALGLSHDTLQRRQRLQAHQNRLREAAEMIRAETGSTLLVRVAHDIRTPMNGVLGMSELLLGTPLSAKQRDYVRTIQSAGNELLGQLDDVLDMARLDAGQIELTEVQFNLQALLEESLDAFRIRAGDRDIEFITFIQPNTPATLCGDPARLRQILRALLEQAFQREGVREILLGLSFEQGRLRAPRLRVSVQDDGRALEETTRERLLAAEVPTNPGELPPGLLVARRLVDLMHGEFSWGSGKQGNGNILGFSIELAASHPASSGERRRDERLQDVRLLIVDDNETCRKVLQQQCSAWGMQAQTAASGREALAMLRTRALLGEHFDAVLLDQEMPGMTGLQLASRIMEDKTLHEDLLLIMLSGQPDAPGKVPARNAGIKRVLAKPVAGYTLRTTLAEELMRTAEAPPAAPQQVIPEGFRVLVAEDNEVSARVIRGLLNKLDVQPDTASDGEQALQALRSQHYDLVLMDCEMPNLDGFTATRQLREWERQQQREPVPVVALTAHTLPEQRERSREAGMDGHLSKPVELSQLRATLLHWATRKAPPTQAS